MQVFEKKTILAGARASGSRIGMRINIRDYVREMEIVNKFKEGMGQSDVW